jgi:hypothetical protein
VPCPSIGAAAALAGSIEAARASFVVGPYR